MCKSMLCLRDTSQAAKLWLWQSCAPEYTQQPLVLGHTDQVWSAGRRYWIWRQACLLDLEIASRLVLVLAVPQAASSGCVILVILDMSCILVPALPQAAGSGGGHVGECRATAARCGGCRPLSGPPPGPARLLAPRRSQGDITASAVVSCQCHLCAVRAMPSASSLSRPGPGELPRRVVFEPLRVCSHVPVVPFFTVILDVGGIERVVQHASEWRTQL